MEALFETVLSTCASNLRYLCGVLIMFIFATNRLTKVIGQKVQSTSSSHTSCYITHYFMKHL